MFSLHCVDRSSAEAVRQRKENLGREFPGHSPDPLRGNDNGRKAKRYDVKIRRRVDRKRENSAILFSFQIVVQFGIDDIRDELANALQVCLDSGAKKVLLPITSAADLGTVPSELIGCFNLIFYQSA